MESESFALTGGSLVLVPRRSGGRIVLPTTVLRVDRPEDLAPAFERARKLMAEFRVPVLVEVLLERVTNIAMGTELDNVVEFEELATLDEHAPSAIALLD